MSAIVLKIMRRNRRRKFRNPGTVSDTYTILETEEKRQSKEGLKITLSPSNFPMANKEVPSCESLGSTGYVSCR